MSEDTTKQNSEHVSIPEILPPDKLREAKAYGRIGLRCTFADMLIDFVFLALATLILARPAAEQLDARLVSPYFTLLALLTGITVVNLLISLPLTFYSGYTVEQRFGLSTLTPGHWFRRYLLQTVLALALNLALMTALFALIRVCGPHWRWAAALAFLAFSVLFGMLLPVAVLPLFYKIQPLDNPELLARFQTLTAGTGLKISGIYRMDMSVETSKANACLAGLGKTRRVLLGDTLLGNYSDDEIAAIFAHEVGHHVHRHMLKLMGIFFISSFGLFFLMDVLMRAWVGDGFEYAAFPAWGMIFLLFIFSILGTLLGPIQNAISRHFERQADAYARSSVSPKALADAFIKLAIQNKADPDPHWLEVFWFDSHPSLGERIRSCQKDKIG